jgi:hypothetical protein
VLALGGQCNEGFQIVTEDFGGEVLAYSLMRQAGDMLEIQPVLESPEGDLDTPPLVVEITESLGRKWGFWPKPPKICTSGTGLV